MHVFSLAPALTWLNPPPHPSLQLRLVLAGKAPTPSECFLHPGRKVCNIDRLLELA